VAWKKCTKPKKKGGIGIINLRSQNNALLLKHLDKFYSRKNMPWVRLIWNAHHPSGEVPHASKNKGSFWWRDVMKLVDLFRGIASCRIGDGSTVLFWVDVWNNHLLHSEFPMLFSFAKNKKISVAQFLLNNNIEQQFHLPLSVQAFQEYRIFSCLYNKFKLQIKPRTTGVTFGFGTHKPFIWIWNLKCVNKIKVFSWFLLMDILNVRNILRRKKHKL
jgi:hypothetical protein